MLYFVSERWIVPEQTDTGAGIDVRERQELDRVLQSGLFSRAPLLERFLTYVCEKRFRGEADSIKEYNIAVDALGRPPEFDHTRDAIVRVEAHRLRKRLREFYQTAGASHALEIVIPSGQYVPQFVPRPRPEPPGLSDPAAEANSSKGAFRGWRGAAITGIFLSALILLLAVPLRKDVAATAPSSLPSRKPIRILVGAERGRFVDPFGDVWDRDRFFTGGESAPSDVPQELSGLPATLFGSRRQGRFRYDIPLEEGVYQLNLFFAETDRTARRSMTVLANGRALARQLDVGSEADGLGATLIKVYRDISRAADGKLHLEFLGANPVLHALELLPAAPGAMRPVRILAGRTGVHHDGAGEFWSADVFYRGGQTTTRRQKIGGVADHNLFAGERYGRFSYIVPVAEGRYTVRLGFAETWFGDQNPEPGGAGSRVFDVFCNNRPLLTAFDIFRAAGGENRALTETFRGIQPDTAGQIVLRFIPRVNNACVNFVEVLPEI